MNYIFLFIISITIGNSFTNGEELDYFPAYDFSLNLLKEEKIDSVFKLSSLKGNVILLNFWATWCGPCIAEIPEFNELYNKYNNQGFEILGISISDTQAQLNKFISKIDVDYNLLYSNPDEMSVVLQNYGGLNSVPISFLINREGLLVRGYPGAILGEYWTSLLHNDILNFLKDTTFKKQENVNDESIN